MSKGKARVAKPLRDRLNISGYRRQGYENEYRRAADGDQKATGRRPILPNRSRRGRVWSYNIGYGVSDNGFTRAFEHPAVFPYKLASDLINAYSNEGDLVIDPMCGSGTTLQAAQFLKRRAVGIDVNPDYCELSKVRVAQDVLV